MKLIISIIILLTLNACTKEDRNTKVQYLDAYEAHFLIQSGRAVTCTDIQNGKKYNLIKNQFTFPVGGMYFYNINNQPISTEKCILQD